MPLEQLDLVAEAKLKTLFNSVSDKKSYEASGVTVNSDRIYIVLDNSSRLFSLSTNLTEPTKLGNKYPNIGYEGISHNPIENKYYLLEEALEHKHQLNGRLRVLDEEFNLERDDWLRYNFQDINKGFEGIAYIRRNSHDYILALCEGNDCETGNTGQDPGAGRIKVFKLKKNKLKYVASIRLPTNLPFIDFSGIAINQLNQVVISSQQSAAVWIAKLDANSWEFIDAGSLYTFPRDRNGDTLYCNIEGVDWLSNHQLITVSDAIKASQSQGCRHKTQSVHIMSIPTVSAPPASGN